MDALIYFKWLLYAMQIHNETSLSTNNFSALIS